MYNEELFMCGITGRYFMANRKQLVELLETLTVNKATVGGACLALSNIGGMPFPPKHAVEYMNGYTMTGYKFIECKTDDGRDFVSVRIQYE